MTGLLKRLLFHRIAIVMLLPLCLYILGFTILPILSCLTLSLYSKTGGSFPVWDHYLHIFGQSDFISALFNTIIITVIGVSVELAFGLLLAVAITSIRKGRSIIRTLLLVPIGVPTLVSAVAMTYIFASNGYLNEFLFRLGLFSVPIDWKSGGLATFVMVIIADMWKVTPLIILLMLAGLQTIPKEIYEAAETDGASSWQTFRYITLPLLKPVITMAVIIRGIDAFRIFELPMILVGKSFPVLGTFAFHEYSDYNNPNTSAAASVILLTVILLFVATYLYLMWRQDRLDV